MLTALASPDCPAQRRIRHHRREARLRRASVVEWDTVFLPNGPDLRPDQLHALLAESGSGKPHEYRVAVDAFNDLMAGGLE